MNALEEILEFRKTAKCVSTSHYLSLEEYNEIILLLLNFFKEFTVKVLKTAPYNYPNNKLIEITIPMRQ